MQKRVALRDIGKKQLGQRCKSNSLVSTFLLDDGKRSRCVRAGSPADLLGLC